MKEIPKYQNLFKGTGVGGMGSTHTPDNKKVDIKTLAGDARAYREAKSKGLV